MSWKTSHEKPVIIFYFNNFTLSFFIPRQVKSKKINNVLWTENMIEKPDLTEELCQKTPQKDSSHF